MSAEGFRFPATTARAEVRDRGSRFLAVVSPARDESAAACEIGRLEEEFRDATHVCWAWRIGDPPRERSSDAGEPGGTAGAPILQALRTHEMSDAALAVVRWFGGTKLGRGGLIRAYGAAARAVLEDVPRISRVPTCELTIEVPHERAGAVKRLLRPPTIELVDEVYSSVARLRLRAHRAQEDALRAALADLGAKLL